MMYWVSVHMGRDCKSENCRNVCFITSICLCDSKFSQLKFNLNLLPFFIVDDLLIYWWWLIWSCCLLFIVVRTVHLWNPYSVAFILVSSGSRAASSLDWELKSQRNFLVYTACTGAGRGRVQLLSMLYVLCNSTHRRHDIKTVIHSHSLHLKPFFT